MLSRICPLNTGKGDRIKYIQNKKGLTTSLGGAVRRGFIQLGEINTAGGRRLRHCRNLHLRLVLYRRPVVYLALNLRSTAGLILEVLTEFLNFR